MITELRVTLGAHTRDNSMVPWWSGVPKIKRRKVFEFKPGLNILWGPNGVGKSTVLTAVTRTLCCDQGGVMAVTQEAVAQAFKMTPLPAPEGWHNLSEREKGMRCFRGAFQVQHDGQAVAFTGEAVGLLGGGAAFDEDFFEQGIANVLFKGSSGQTTLQRLARTLKVAKDGRVPPVQDKIGTNVNDLWLARRDILMETLEPTIETGQPTVILDEPDRSLDIPSQDILWKILAQMSEHCQIIVATHSPFALRHAPESTTWMDFEKGYLDKCREVVRSF